MNKPNQLARVCTECGVKKPLSAFLQLGGANGTTYGMICSECRRTSIQPKQSTPKDTEERSSSSSGLRIGAQQKIAIESEKKQQHKDKKELSHIEEKNRDELKAEKLLREESKLKSEKEHRIFYIETKKQGFLSNIANKAPVAKQVFNAQQIKDNRAESVRKAELNNDQTSKQDAATQQEIKLTTIDLTLPFLAPQVTEMRHNSSTFLQFKQWLGGGAPIGKAHVLKNLESIYKKVEMMQNKQSQDKLNKKSIQKDPLIEQIEKSVGPSSSRKR